TGCFSAMAIFWTTPDQSISLRARAIGSAVINATGNIGSALSPFMIGWLKDLTGSFNSGLWFVAALLVIGAGGVFKQVLVDSGVGPALGEALTGMG
ncbi:hypothetical protein M8375_33705, partial [Klebsiella pneumoniae]|nr:hypothetical protein [Klebsiella pneumoniae]